MNESLNPNDFTPQENKEFADVVFNSYKEKEIELLEVEADTLEFQRDVNKVLAVLRHHADSIAEETDAYVVAAALEILHAEYDEVTDCDD